MYKILVLEDDCLLASQIKFSLKQFNFEIDLVQDLARCEELIKLKDYDLLIFDRLISGQDALTLVDEIRQKNYFVRILLMSCKRLLSDRLNSLQLADDFLAKPFVMAELSLKVRNLLARSRTVFHQARTCASFALADSGIVDNYQTGEAIYFPRREAKILECLLLHQNQIVSYQRLMDYVWEREDQFPQQRTLNVYIRRIRNRLGSLGGTIKTLRGYGFSLDSKKEAG